MTFQHFAVACLLFGIAVRHGAAQQPHIEGKGAMTQFPAKEIPPLHGWERLPFYYPQPEPKVTGATQAVPDNEFTRKLNKLKCGATAWEFRTISGRCNNLKKIDLGARNRGQLLHKEPRGTCPTGKKRPNARGISNVVSDQAENDLPNRRGMSEFVTFFGQFLDHNIVATPARTPEKRMDILVSKDDSEFFEFNPNTTSVMPFKRSARAMTYGRPTVLNSISSFIDLSAVYGDNEDRAEKLRSKKDGKLKVSQGDQLPFNSESLMNAPSLSKEFFIAGDFRANEHVDLTVLHLIWLREHNKLCDSLKRDFPGWGDERLYQMARKINGATFQKVVYEEFFPALTGRLLPRYQGYNKEVDPSISVLFSTAAFRLGHSLVGPDVRRFGSGRAVLPSLKLKDVFFTAPKLLSKFPEEEFLRGMLLTKAQEVDTKATDLIRNFLFSAVEEEDVFDLIAFNIQRGRDHALPSYNEVRVIMGRPRARRYSDITQDCRIRRRLRLAYGTGKVDDVDAWVGLLAEPHIPGGSMGKTMFLIWRQEFARARAGDRFFYERADLFSRKVKGTIYRHGGRTMRDVILRNTKISPSEVQSPWFGKYSRKESCMRKASHFQLLRTDRQNALKQRLIRHTGLVHGGMTFR